MDCLAAADFMQTQMLHQEGTLTVSRLGYEDIPRIISLENASWIPSLRADDNTLYERISQGHVFFGAEVEGQLVALLSSRLGWFTPEDLTDFPKTFSEYASGFSPDFSNTGFVYNLNVDHKVRGRGIARVLMAIAQDEARKVGCKYIVGDGRCPSYNGSMSDEVEFIKQNPRFKEALNIGVATGSLPSIADLLLDPVLRFYFRRLQCTFVKLIPRFIPSDVASGGHRVIFYKQIAADTSSSLEP